MWLKASLRNCTRRQEVENDLDAEISSYREMLADEKTKAGLDAKAARRAAALELGGAEQIKESVRDVRAGVHLENIFAELRQSLRALCRNPALSLLSIATLALGIGACTVVFSVFYSALLRPLPFRDLRSLVDLSETRLSRGIDHAYFSEANFWDVRSRNRSFKEVAAYHYDQANLTGVGEPEKVKLNQVTAGFFRALGVSPFLGRTFSYADETGGWDTHVVIIGNRFWRTRFSADPSIIGKTLRLNDHAFTVIGVLPPGEPWIDSQLYVPFGFRANAERGSWEFRVIARLAPGVSIQAAQSDLARIATALSSEYPAADRGIGFNISSAVGWIAPDKTRLALWVLLGAVIVLLLIGCINVANLLLARGITRHREIAVRSALGTGRGRLIRFVMMESLLLSFTGALLGIVLAYLALDALQTTDLQAIPRISEATINPWVLAFSAAIALLTGILCGLAPALHAPSCEIAIALRDSERQTGSHTQNRLRATLVAGEVALSFVLLFGAGLLIRSFTQLTAVNLGFHTNHRLLFSLSLPDSYYEKNRGQLLINQLLSRISGLPSVIAVGSVSSRPVEGADPGMSIESAFQPQSQSTHSTPWAGWRFVSPGYFRAAGLPLIRGRLFDPHDEWLWDQPGKPAPLGRVIISSFLARTLFADSDPIGQHVTLWKGQSNRDAVVAGVVGDSRERGPASASALTVYFPPGPNAVPADFIVHTQGDPLACMPAIRALITRLDSNLPISDVRSFDEVVQRSVAPQRLNAVLLTTFSGLALVLAVTGLYGVLAYAMSRRTPEIGLRMALGASTLAILRLTVSEGMKPALVGIAVGIVSCLALSRYLSALLFAITPFDAPTYWTVAALLLATALLACLLPGRRAAQTDPATALRCE